MGIIEKLQDFLSKEGLTRNTIGLYVQKIKKLSGTSPSTPIRSLNFLLDIEDIESKIQDLSKSTQITYISAILSALKMLPKTPKKIITIYSNMMGALADSKRKEDVNQKSEKQEKNWMAWDEILMKQKEMKDEFNNIVSKKAGKKLSPQEYQKVQNYVVLSLYTMIPPRRNADYQEMVIVPKLPDTQEKELNYYDQSSKKFYFNNYKTAGTYGQQIVDVPDELAEILDDYARVIPGKNLKFIISKPDGSKLTYSNSVTRIMNRIFKKNISTSLLRHIYLSSKYNLEEMKKDADAMGHSLSEQREYLKFTKDDEDDKKIEEDEEDEEDEEEDEEEKKKRKRGGYRLNNLRVRDDRIMIPDFE